MISNWVCCQWRNNRACKACSARGPSAVGGPKFARRCFLKLFWGRGGPFGILARGPTASLLRHCVLHKYSLGGNTATPSGLYARLCHALLVYINVSTMMLGDEGGDYARARRQLRSLGDDLLTRSRLGQLYINVSGSLVSVDASRTSTSTSLVCPPGSAPDNDRQLCGQ